MIIPIDAEKIEKNATPFHDKNVQQTRNRGDLPLPDRGHL